MSPQMSPPVVELVAERGEIIAQLTLIAKALNKLDADLERGNVLAARESSAEMRAELTGLQHVLGLT